MTTILFNAVDTRLTSQILDPVTGDLSAGAVITLPAKVQYAWRSPHHPVLYVACSAAGPRERSSVNVVVSLAIGPEGAMTVFGPQISLPFRAVHICTDPAGRFLIAAHNLDGGGVTVVSIAHDQSLGAIVEQQDPCDFGVYPHQVRVFPSGQSLLVVDRGINATAETPERPGALRRYALSCQGQLTQAEILAPNGGFGFGPRHVDFHPDQPWAYAVDERFNRLSMYHIAQDRLESEPRYNVDLLEDRTAPKPRQLGGAIHLHPQGHVLYAANRADAAMDFQGQQVFAGGENSIVVYALDPATGAPTAIQHADLETTHARTFALDPSGRILVAASNKPMSRLVDGVAVPTPARLVLFRVAANGTLTRIAVQDVATGPGELQYWCGIMGL